MADNREEKTNEKESKPIPRTRALFSPVPPRFFFCMMSL